ncbi:MAG: PilZ domain-containing protein [Kangiellaceae bacterium]|jgi:hypothetical protein|nr:PilZ domain-containing protein [Kangiellaceae bacterium]
MTDDKRRHPRYLCTDSFGDTTVKHEDDIYTFMSINFSRSGIAIYSHLRLPEFTDCTLSFDINDDDFQVSIMNIDAAVRYRYETETGHQYGVEFTERAIAQFNDQLNSIEAYLKAHDNPENRWGI